ncbi:protein-disulfide reductase DsbD family protein [Spirochaeta isovalerica]|uniref:Thiol:disulfide interchange protein DsbD n=1 Tax=Spirochaeta isovalerica TaxID=150 RepID=A0A841R5W3_9SPIO|nr:thioredoxin family protein [Spirochaeta isovalerica]MBB6478771.1 thiol:disulfide interchange protein DsbD [Spirochaeta isovalerica]
MKKTIFFLLTVFFSFQVYGQFFGTSDIPEVNIVLEVIPSELSPGDTFTVYGTYEIPEHYHIFLNEDFFTITIDNPQIDAGEVFYPMEESKPLLGIPAFSDKVTISRTFSLTDDVNANQIDLEIIASYQMCEDDGACLLPENITFNRTLDISDNGGTSKSPLSVILWYILLAFAGGIILNIMPCVLPLLSVKALNLVEQSSHDKKTILVSSVLYGTGILVSFLILAFSVILLKSSGEAFGWGFQFQNPLFVTVLLTLIFIFSLSLFDIYTFNPPNKGMQKASQHSAGRSYRSSFITGIFAVLVATPCTAPFMGAALGFAFSQTPFVIILIFTALSLGFALPFILLGLFPALIARIPKPGKWMNTFKEFMGFLLLGTMVYLLTTLHSLIGDSIKGVLWFLLFTGLAVWIFGRFGSAIEKKRKRIAVVVIALFIIAGSFYSLVDLTPKNSSENNNIADGVWKVFSEDLVEKYRNEGKPVFVDFYADWCTSCKVNDAAVLDRKKVLDMFESKNVQLLKGDFTSGDRVIARWLAKYERAGVPLYLLFRPGEEAHVFPEFLSIGMIEEELEKIKP